MLNSMNALACLRGKFLLMTPSGIPLIDRARAQPPQRFVLHDAAGYYRSGDLLSASARFAGLLIKEHRDLSERRVAFLVPPCFDYVVVLWAIWRAGGIAVPLCTQHPAAELAYTIEDSGADIVVAHPEYEDLLRPIAARLGQRFLLTTHLPARPPAALPFVAPARGALLIYTSGTTGKPKGALTTHAILAAQIQSLVTAWEWSSADRTVLVLPLHHIHGILNVLSCALWVGASCELLRGFDPVAVFQRLRENRLTLFMAVPTIYTRLIAAWEAAPPDEQAALAIGCRRLRLMVSRNRL